MLPEQLETIHGRERVVLRKRFGFVKLAMEHGTPLVPTYVFGSSDLYYTSRLLHGARMAVVKSLRIAIPVYWGGWGFFAYPSPKGFPLLVQQARSHDRTPQASFRACAQMARACTPQNVVFGDPLPMERVEKPTNEQVAAEHARFVVALTSLFDEHKGRFGAAGRTLEVL
jgi:hypothetical protein